MEGDSAAGGVPVSYTHLDVYKRQAFERLQSKIEQFVENREEFCYSSIGVVF